VPKGESPYSQITPSWHNPPPLLQRPHYTSNPFRSYTVRYSQQIYYIRCCCCKCHVVVVIIIYRYCYWRESCHRTKQKMHIEGTIYALCTILPGIVQVKLNFTYSRVTSSRLITCSPGCETGPIESDETGTKNNDFSYRLTQQYYIIRPRI